MLQQLLITGKADGSSTKVSLLWSLANDNMLYFYKGFAPLELADDNMLYFYKGVAPLELG